MIGIQSYDKFAFSMLQRIIQIAGLGMSSIGPRNVLASDFTRQIMYLGAVAIIEEVRSVGIAHAHSTDGCVAQQIDRFVVSRNEYIHASVGKRRLGGVMRAFPCGEVKQ